MHISRISACFLSITAANAVTMKYYSAASNVPAGFQAYLEGIYAAAEDPVATTGFTDYFPADGELTVLTTDAIGAEDILALKQTLMPVEGYKVWNHYPNTVTVTSDTTVQAIYHVIGKIETTYDAAHYGNCSSASYISEFTILKTNSTLDFTLANGKLQWYNDMEVTPEYSPTSIACTY